MDVCDLSAVEPGAALRRREPDPLLFDRCKEARCIHSTR
jgi:hypothetical protein